MAITPLAFTGISKYSQDFQTILNRAVSIAALPVQQLQNKQTDIVQQKQLVGSLSDAVSRLSSSIQSLTAVAQAHGLVATSSNASKVSVTNTGATSTGSFQITDISSIASAASETSVAGYQTSDSTPVSASGTVKLVIGGTERRIQLTPANNNLVGLRDAINGLNLGVTATVLTTGTGTTPNYLLVTANTTGATSLRLVEDPDNAATDLLTTNNQGSNANFKLNGVPISQATNVVNSVVPGLTFNILGTTDTGETVNLRLQTDRGQLASALEDLVSKYNATASQVNAQIGPNAGLLSGDWLVRQIQNSLRQVVNFQGMGTIRNLADLGIEMSNTGEMSFNETTFSALTDGQISAAFEFIGSATQGFGSLARSFNQISDPATGLIKLQQDQYDETDRRITEQIATMTDRINAMQASLSAKLQAADALLAQLSSQQSVLDSSIQALNFSVYGKQDH